MIVLPSKASPEVERLLEDNLIVADLPCVRCAYNLRGLAPDSRCPECGQEILLAIRGRAHWSKLGGGAPWLAKVGRGCRLAAGWYLLLLPAPLVFAAGYVVARWLGLAFTAGWIAAHLLAVWWMTGPRASEGDTTGVSALRLAARWLAFLPCVPLLVPIVGRTPISVEVVLSAALLAYLAAYAALMGYLRRLALLAGDSSMARLALHAAWVWPAGLVLPFPTAVVASKWLLLILVMAVGGSILAGITFMEYARAFGEAARLADSRREAPPPASA